MPVIVRASRPCAQISEAPVLVPREQRPTGWLNNRDLIRLVLRRVLQKLQRVFR